MEYNEKLLTPLNYYKENLKNDFLESVQNYIENLKNESNIDTEKNAKEVEKYNLFEKEKKKINLIKNLLIALFVVSIILSLINGYSAYTTTEKMFPIALTVLFIFLAFFIYTKIKQKKEELVKATAKCEEQLKVCYETMEALNNLLCSETTHDLIRKNIPFIHLDRNFDKKRFEQLKFNYDLEDNNNIDSSALELVSGDILGNPFVIIGSLNHHIIDYTYTGHRTISYTEYYTDSDGKRKSRTVTETLTASVTKPKPDYYGDIELIYACDAAPNLKFTRKPSLKSKTFGFLKDPNIKALEKAQKSSSTFVPMANEEFDSKFGAFDRNNETEFRLLFTNIAQDNMLKLIKDDTYGDDFYFRKYNKLNFISANHTDNWNLNTFSNKKSHYDFEEFKRYFEYINTEYFQHFYYLMLPILSIPIYQQYKSKEYIYGNLLKYNYNGYITETVANSMGENNFVHSNSKTRAILKSENYSSESDVDLVKITAYSYDEIRRCTIIPVRGGDGRYYDVSVYWYEYIPLEKESLIEVMDTNMKEKEFTDFINDRDNYQNIFEGSFAHSYKNNILGFLTNNSGFNYNRKFKEILSRYKK